MDLKECAVVLAQPIIIIHKTKQLNIIVRVVMLHALDVQIHQQVIVPYVTKIKQATNIYLL